MSAWVFVHASVCVRLCACACACQCACVRVCVCVCVCVSAQVSIVSVSLCVLKELLFVYTFKSTHLRKSFFLPSLNLAHTIIKLLQKSFY